MTRQVSIFALVSPLRFCYNSDRFLGSLKIKVNILSEYGLESEPRPPENRPQNTVQTLSAIIAAAASLFTSLSQSKEHPRLAWAFLAVALFAVIGAFGTPLIALILKRRKRTARNKAAVARLPELIRLANRFTKFLSNGDPTNIRQVLLQAVQYQEKLAELMPPDYLFELFPYYVRELEEQPPKTEAQFLLAVQYFHSLIASYDNNYVLEPFRKMRLKTWPITQSPIDAPAGDAEKPKPRCWIESLPEMRRDDIQMRIEDFRERWVVFLDDAQEFFEQIRESFADHLGTYLERPKKL
jgi:hypothetical protein